MAGPNRLNRHSGRASSLHVLSLSPLLSLPREAGSPIVTAHGDS